MLALILSSCENTLFKSGISEGKIEYEISYPNIPQENFILELLPKTMITTFVDNNYRSDIIAGMGIFKTSIICSEDNENLIHSIKMLKTKYASELSEKDFESFNPEFNDVEITLTNDTKKIAGYSCKSADVLVEGDSTWNFKVFYTDEINIRKSNAHTPFKQINGVLMEYQFLSNNILMNFIATKIIAKEVDAEAVQLEDGYEMVSPTVLKEEIQKLFANIM